MTWLYSMSEGHQQANDKANKTTKTMTIDEVILAHRHAYYADWKLLLRESVVGRKIFFMAGKKGPDVSEKLLILKFIYCEKTIKFETIFHLFLTLLCSVKTDWSFFSSCGLLRNTEYMNFTNKHFCNELILI